MEHKPARDWKSQNTEYVTRINKIRRHFYWSRQDPYWGFGNSMSENSSVGLSVNTHYGEQEGKYWFVKFLFQWLSLNELREFDHS